MTRRGDLYYTLGIPQLSDPRWFEDPNREQRYTDSDRFIELMKDHPIMDNNYGNWAADTVSDQAKQADVVAMWDLQEADHADAVLRGLCQATFAEYSARLQTVVARLRESGSKVAFVKATPAQVAAKLQEKGLPNDAGGRAAAVGLLFTEQCQTPKEGS